MAISMRNKLKVEQWLEELKRYFYTKLGDITLTGFNTYEILPLEDVKKRSFYPMPAGTKWGRKWEYYWFKGIITLPKEADGKRIVLDINVGADCLIYLNDKILGANDVNHRNQLLSVNGSKGTNYEILFESYAGHAYSDMHTKVPLPKKNLMGKSGSHIGSEIRHPSVRVFPLVPDIDEDEKQAITGNSSFGIWNEELYQLYMDIDTLFRLRNSIDEHTLRVQEIDTMLVEFIHTIDFEQPFADLLICAESFRNIVKPLLECVNGTTAPEYYAFGHGHLDVIWRWPLNETIRKSARTLSNQLALIDQYPEHKFLFCQPQLIKFIKDYYPELYERAKKAVKAGNILIEGGMWVEPDTNIPSGESLIRQIIHGKRFLKEEFDYDCEFLWLPDSFGYSASLPQIINKCGMKYFSTGKLITYNEIPYNSFYWVGLDGSRVLSHRCNQYGGRPTPDILLDRCYNREQQDDISALLLPFGQGDGGGGPSRENLEYLKREKDLEGLPRVKITSPNEFFHKLEKKGSSLPECNGELYYAAHHGTFTTQAKIKRLNRKCEFMLREVELWGALASATASFDYPLQAMDNLWKKVLLNQFHDVISGASIERANREAEGDFSYVISQTESLLHNILQNIVRNNDELGSSDESKENSYITIFNSLPWDRRDLLPLSENASSLIDMEGNSMPIQKIDNQAYAMVEIPSCGFSSFGLSNKEYAIDHKLKATKECLENKFLKIIFNSSGEIVSIFDKETQQEFADGLCNQFNMYRDIPSSFDAWDIDWDYQSMPVELSKDAEINVIGQGPLFAGIRIKRKLNQSYLFQDIILTDNNRRVDFRTTVEWNETHKLLKVNFPVKIHSMEGLHEVQFGHIKRSAHLSRRKDIDQFEVCNHKWSALTNENCGFALLNDCKYGININNNSINLTLLKSPIAPDFTADKGVQNFTYSFYLWHVPFVESEVIREAYQLNYTCAYTNGSLGKRSFFNLDVDNIIIETIKPAEDGSNDIVLRLYEAKRMISKTVLSIDLPIIQASETNMLEEIQVPLEIKGGKIELFFTPFEIKTIRLKI